MVSLAAGGIIQVDSEAQDSSRSGLTKYDPTRVHLIWGGIPLSQGIVKGTFITVARNVKTWRLEHGIDGESERVRSDDQSGVVSLTLMAGSRMNSVMSSIATADELTGIFATALYLQDFSGHSIHSSAFAYIESIPDKAYDVVPIPVRWDLICRRLLTAPGGSRPA